MVQSVPREFRKEEHFPFRDLLTTLMKYSTHPGNSHFSLPHFPLGKVEEENVGEEKLRDRAAPPLKTTRRHHYSQGDDRVTLRPPT